jgi:putative membrane protein
MVSDHSKANDELKAIAQRKNIAMPMSLSDERSKVKEKLAEKSGKDFDKAYINEMVSDHKKDVDLFEDALNKVKDEELRTFINNTLPTLRAHLEHIKGIDKAK